MEKYISLINLTFYALYSFFFTVYIVPLLKNAREIKNNLYSFNLPYIENQPASLNNEQSKQVREYIRVLRRYESEYEDVEQLIQHLLRDILVISLGLFLLFYLDADFQISLIPSGNLILLSLTIFLIYSMIRGFRFYIPSVNQLSEMEYLIKKQGISAQNLISCSDISISMGVDHRSGEEFKADAPKHISLYSQFPLIGYRYLLCVFKGAELFYKNYGLISKNTKLTKIDLDRPNQDFNFLAHYIDIGEFIFTEKKEQELDVYIFIFDPCVESSIENSPLYAHGNCKMSSHITATSCTCKINVMRTFTAIQYIGKGLKFEKIKWHNLSRYPVGNANHVDLLKEVITNDGSRICKSKKTREL